MFAIRMLALSAFVLLSSLFAVAYAAEIPDEQKWHVGEEEVVVTAWFCVTPEAASAGREIRFATLQLPAEAIVGVMGKNGCIFARDVSLTFQGPVENPDPKVAPNGNTYVIVRVTNDGGEAFGWMNVDFISDKLAPTI